MNLTGEIEDRLGALRDSLKSQMQIPAKQNFSAEPFLNQYAAAAVNFLEDKGISRESAHQSVTNTFARDGGISASNSNVVERITGQSNFR